MKIRRGDGKVVGNVEGDTFYKVVSGRRHFLQVPPAICSDVDALTQAHEVGAQFIQVLDRDTGKTYWAKIATVLGQGFPVERGNGIQVGLPMRYWVHEKPVEQLALL